MKSNSFDKNRVGIVSYALTSYKGETEMLGEELVFQVCRSALDKAGITRDELDAVAIASQDFNDGITISLGPLVPAAGGYNSNKDAVRVESGGVFAIISAYAAILAGNANCVMVASADTAEFDPMIISNMSYDPVFRRDVGVNSTIASAMVATSYMHRHGATEADYALVAAKNYAAGSLNPYAHIRNGYSVEEILASPVITWPLRAHECCPLSFGGTALLLASEEKAMDLCDDPVWITGCGMSSERYYGNWVEILEMSALRSASQDAYRRAGIKDPGNEIGTAEVSSPFAPLELLEYEALGLCDNGTALKILHEGTTATDGKLPVNLAGGNLCTNGPNSDGLFKTIQAVMNLKNELPGTKSNAEKAIIHDSDVYLGFPGASHAVLILERGR